MEELSQDAETQALIASLPEPALLTGGDGMIAAVNDRAERLLRSDARALIGTPLADVLPGVAAASTGQALSVAFERVEVARRLDGVETPVEVALAPVSSIRGELQLAILHDVSERVRVETELRRTRDRLLNAEHLARLGSWEWDIPANDVTWSDELFRIYGLEPGETTPSYEGFLERVHPDDRESVDERNRKAFADHQPFEDVKRCVRPDGTEFLMRTQGEVLVDSEGAPLRMVGVCEDVTAERKAAEAEARLASIVRDSSDAIILTTPEGIIKAWNPAAEALYGHSESEALDRHFEFLVPEHLRDGENAIRERVIAGEQMEHYETKRLRKDGTEVHVSLTRSQVRDAEGGLAGLSTIARDITEQKRIASQLVRLANHDPLTRLFNRNRFEEELSARVAHSERYEEPGALLLLDLDNFKYVNDTFGHRAGDELLRSVAELLRRRMRESDVLARLGGDEFAMLLPATDPAKATEVAEAVLHELREHTLPIEGHPVRVTTSIGVIPFGGSEQSAEELLADADRAMYAAKDAGRDRAAVSEQVASGRAPERRIGWEHRIRDALDNDLFVLHSQPILDLRSDEVSQHELLIRMRDGDGLSPPGAFLGVAERLGLIHSIDRWVVGEAIQALASRPDLHLEVNLSGRSVDDRQLVEMISSELDNAGVEPGRLILEITETAAIASIDQAREFAEDLMAVGCRFALDDFGAGFGSFYYLKHFPAEYLKIDGEFIRGPRSRTDNLIVESMVRIAGELDKVTIAEFVEDQAGLDDVRERGVDLAQGFHIGRPEPLEDLLAAAPA